jgi:hypothetical protein
MATDGGFAVRVRVRVVKSVQARGVSRGLGPFGVVEFESGSAKVTLALC